MRSNVATIVMVALLCGWVAACGERAVDSEGKGWIALAVSYGQGAAKRAGIQRMERMAVALIRSGEVFLERDLEWGRERWRGEFEVEAGDYEIRLKAYKEGEVRWRGEVETAVRQGERALVEISMDRLYLLQVSAQSLDLGSDAALGEFRVSNGGIASVSPGDGRLRWQVVEEAGWLTVTASGMSGSTDDGALSGEGNVALVAQVNREGLQGGIYSTELRIRSNGGDAIVPVRMTVEIEEPPPPPSGETLVAELPGGAQMEFVWVERGGFWMGSPVDEPGHSINEGPRHWVNIGEGFYIGRYEVTQAQWTGAMASNPSRFGGNERPVDSVSWADAQAFVHQLNVAAGDSLYRLPTEAEWEYAARAGTDTPWSFGNDEEVLGEYAWYEGNDDTGETRDVGLKQPNPWGLYDVHGNVWEWVQDWYGEQYYGESPEADPPGPATGSARVMRGGAFNHGVSFLRSADRLRFDPTVRSSNVGIRLVRVR